MKQPTHGDKGNADNASHLRPEAQSSYAVYRQIGALIGLGLLQSLSFGIMAPMMPIITTEYFAREYTKGTPINCGKHAKTDACVFGSKEADWWSSIFSATGCLLLFFLSPIIGQASDTYGRKIFLVLSQVARLGVPFTVLLFAEYGGSIMPYFALRFVDSAFGTASVSSAAVADVVSPANRAAAFGILFATFMIGYCISAGLAPFFSRYHALQVSCVLFVLRVIWAVFLLPETLPPSKRAKKSSRRIENPIRAMAILWRSQLFIRLTCLIALTSFVTNGLYQIQLFYLNTVVSFNEKDTSRIMLFGGVLGILAQLFLLKPLMDCFKEKGVIVIALLASIIQCVGYTISAYYPEKWLLFAFAVPSTLSDFAFAAIASLKSINVSEKEQGRLQGAIYGARAIFEAAGPVVYAAIYSRMKAHSPFSCAVPFILSGVLYIISIGVALSLPVPAHSGIKTPPLMSPTVIATPSSSMFFSTDDEGDSESDGLSSFDRETEEVLVEPLLGPSSSSAYADV